MPHEIPYFDSQASAAAILNIDLYKLRAAKRAGCPAFRSGRVYRQELLDWFEEQDRRNTPEGVAKIKEKERRISIVTGIIVNLVEMAELGLISEERMVEIGTEVNRPITQDLRCLPEAKGVLKEWATIVCDFLFSKYRTLAGAHKAYPKLVGWLCLAGGLKGVTYGGKEYPAQ